MEVLESGEMHSEDDKAYSDKNKKRTVKTPSQVQALETFYDEHKYPTETMKSQLAESIGLTEKQISGWFCHRRLKDKKLLNGEAYGSGRQDRSSVVIQDRGSGLRQDSCGSTKQADERTIDPREVESRRFVVQEQSNPDPTYEIGTRYASNHGHKDDTSSGSSSSLKNMYYQQSSGRFGMPAAKYPRLSQPTEMKDVRPRNGPSGYLKVKGQVENASITAVKRQLGRLYREDGPPLGVVFDPLPPGAFESSMQEPENEPYYSGDYVKPNLQDVYKGGSQLISGTGHEYNRRSGHHVPDVEGASLKTMHMSDYSDRMVRQKFKQNPSALHRNNYYHERNSSLGMEVDPIRVNPVNDSRDNHQMRTKHIVKEMHAPLLSGHQNLHLYGGKGNKEQEPRLQHFNDGGPKVFEREQFESKTSSSARMGGGHNNFEDKWFPTRQKKEGRINGETRTGSGGGRDLASVKIPLKDERRAAKRARNEDPQHQHLREASPVGIWTNQVMRSDAEMQSSFSEDEETAETSLSAD